jgi:hypothetical protein
MPPPKPYNLHLEPCLAIIVNRTPQAMTQTITLNSKPHCDTWKLCKNRLGEGTLPLVRRFICALLERPLALPQIAQMSQLKKAEDARMFPHDGCLS